LFLACDQTTKYKNYILLLNIQVGTYIVFMVAGGQVKAGWTYVERKTNSSVGDVSFPRSARLQFQSEFSV